MVPSWQLLPLYFHCNHANQERSLKLWPSNPRKLQSCGESWVGGNDSVCVCGERVSNNQLSNADSDKHHRWPLISVSDMSPMESSILDQTRFNCIRVVRLERKGRTRQNEWSLPNPEAMLILLVRFSRFQVKHHLITFLWLSNEKYFAPNFLAEISERHFLLT